MRNTRPAIFGSPVRRYLLAALLATTGCTSITAGDSAIPDPSSRSICIAHHAGPIPLLVEIADTPAARATGLKHRRQLAEDRGMLFVFEKQRPATAAFWMHETLIPLDIAYLDQRGTIVAIRQMTPCKTARKADCPRYPAGRPFHYALEVNRGFFGRHGVGTGHRVVLEPGACPAGQGELPQAAPK